jgi:threonine dehydratase
MTANPPSTLNLSLNLSPPQNGLVVTDSPERSPYTPKMKALTEYNSLDPAPAAPSFEGIPKSFLLPDGYPDYLRMILTSRVYEITHETQLTSAVNLSTKMGVRVVLKREDLQPVFSFKIRGAYNKMAHIPEEERWKGVVACSAGTKETRVHLVG